MSLLQETIGLFLSNIFITIKLNFVFVLVFVAYLSLIVFHSQLFLNFIPKNKITHSD